MCISNFNVLLLASFSNSFERSIKRRRCQRKKCQEEVSRARAARQRDGKKKKLWEHEMSGEGSGKTRDVKRMRWKNVKGMSNQTAVTVNGSKLCRLSAALDRDFLLDISSCLHSCRNYLLLTESNTSRKKPKEHINLGHSNLEVRM